MNWQKLDGEYRRRKKAAEARVVRWEWASAADRSRQPLLFEREKQPRGRRIPPPRRPQEGQVAYGLDAEGEVAVEREYCGLVRAGERWCYESFHDHDGWIRYGYSPNKDTVAVNRVRHADTEIVELKRTGRHGGFVERYRWQGGRVVRIDREGDDGWQDWFEITWDGDQPAEILGWDPFRKRTSIVYARPRETLVQLAAAVEQRLVLLIPRALAQCRFAEPMFSLVLAYDGTGNDMLPPAVGVGLQSERAAWSDPQILWNPAEYRNYPILLPRDEKLSVLCRKLNQQIAMKQGFAEGRRLLERVAAALRKRSWKKTTPDFVIYAVDFELLGLARALREAGALKKARPKAASQRRRSSRP